MKNKNLKYIMIITISLALASVFFFFSFSGFSTIVATQDVVNQDEIFISTDQTAVDGFVETLEDELTIEKDQALGIILTVVLKDSNGKIIPQNQNFLSIPQLGSIVSTSTGELLDFAKIQFDFEAVLVKDDRIGELSGKYEVLSNNVKVISGTIHGSGMTVNNHLNLRFEQGEKKGDAIELNFENKEIPTIVGHNTPYTNTLQLRVTQIEAVVGESFNTERFFWNGTFPVYTLKYDADDRTRTIRDFRGIAIQTLPNDVGLQVCGYDSGRLHGKQNFNAFAPTIKVKSSTGAVILESSPPKWGSRDADFNSLKCGNIVSGLDRNTNYKFIMQDGTSFDITTPNTPMLYTASCKFQSVGTSQNPSTIFPCTSNFGWSK